MRVTRSTGASTRHPIGPYLIVLIVVAVVLAGIDVVALALNSPSRVLSHHYYLALGNSLAYGYQPNADFTNGYTHDVFNTLQGANVDFLVNYACPSESSTTFINGSCPDSFIKHTQYFGPQLAAAVSFLKAHRGQVNPVTIDLGANDVINDFNPTTCTVAASAQADITTFDTNLTQTILPQLTSAYTTTMGARAGEFVMLNYYDPYVKECPNSLSLIQQLNTHIANDAAKFDVKVADIYTAFGGTDHMAANICAYTWICDAQFHDIHPTTTGYSVMANAVENTLHLPGIGPGSNPLSPGLPFPPFGAMVNPRSAWISSQQG